MKLLYNVLGQTTSFSLKCPNWEISQPSSQTILHPLYPIKRCQISQNLVTWRYSTSNMMILEGEKNIVPVVSANSCGSSEVDSTTMEVDKEIEKGSIFMFFERKDIPLALSASVAVVISSLGSPLQTIFYGKVFEKLTLFLGTSDYGYQVFINDCRSLCGFIMIIGAVRMVFTWLGMFLWMQFGEVQQGRARSMVYKMHLSKSFSWYDQQLGLMGETSQINRCIEELRAGTSQEIAQLVKVFSSIISLFLTSMIYSWSLTLVIISSTPLMAACGWYFGNLTFKASDKENHYTAMASNILDWNFANGDIVRMFNGKFEEIVKFKKVINLSAKAFYSLVNVAGINIGLLRSLSLISIVQGIWFGSHMIKIGKLEIANVFTTLSSCILLGSNIGMLSNLLAALNKAQAAISKIKKFLNCDSETETDGTYSPIVPANGSITFRDVDFQYNSVENKVLHDLNFDLDARKTTFIVGSSGSGKSTIAQLLMKFYSPTNGHITIDGYDLGFLDKSWVRRNVSLVSLNAMVFDGTIRDNVSLARNMDNRFESYADISEAISFARIGNLGKREDSMISSTSLSGGQRQKISLARAKLRDPPILILDEPLSAVDIKDRLQIFDNIRKWRKGKTTIIITHDFSQIKDNDRVVVIQNGCLKHNALFFEIKSSLVLNAEINTLISDEKTVVSSSSPNKATKTYDFLKNPVIIQDLENNSSLQQKEQSDEIKSVYSILKYCHSNIDSKFLIAIGLIISVVSAIASPVYSFCISKLLQNMVSASLNISGVEKALVLWSCIVIGISCVDGLSHYLSMYILNYASEKWINNLRNLIFGKISDQDMSFFDKCSSKPAELTSLLMNDARDLRNLVADFLSVAINLVTMLLAGITWSLIAGWKLALVGISFVPLTILITCIYSKMLTFWEASYKEEIVKIENFNRDTIIGLKTILGYGIQDSFVETFEKNLQTVKRVGTRRSLATGFGISISELCTSLATGTVLYYGVVLVGKGEYTQANMLQVITILTFTLANAVSLLDQLPDIARGQRGGTYIIKLMKLAPSDVENIGCKTIAKFQGSIRFEGVSLSYASSPSTALDDFSLNIFENQKAVIVGQSGSGKSTVASVLMRLFPIDKGFARISNHDIHELDVFWLREKISIVPQVPRFFEGTIYENLVYGLDPIKVLQQTILRALELSNSINFVRAMKNGIHTNIGGSNTPQVSTGQLQRLSIARALLRNPQILLLDECTANLDPENTRIIMDLIQNKLSKNNGLTIVIITHDKNMMNIGDNLIVMKNGQVVEQGKNYSSLYNKHEELYALVKDPVS